MAKRSRIGCILEGNPAGAIRRNPSENVYVQHDRWPALQKHGQPRRHVCRRCGRLQPRPDLGGCRDDEDIPRDGQGIYFDTNVPKRRTH